MIARLGILLLMTYVTMGGQVSYVFAGGNDEWSQVSTCHTIPSDTALLDYLVVAEDLVATVTTQQGAVVVDLGIESAAQLERECQAYSSVLSSTPRGAPSVDGHARAASLGQKLFLPVRPHLDGVSNLIIRTESICSSLPFEALVVGNDKYLIEDYATTYRESRTEGEKQGCLGYETRNAVGELSWRGANVIVGASLSVTDSSSVTGSVPWAFSDSSGTYILLAGAPDSNLNLTQFFGETFYTTPSLSCSSNRTDRSSEQQVCEIQNKSSLLIERTGRLGGRTRAVWLDDDAATTFMHEMAHTAFLERNEDTHQGQGSAAITILDRWSTTPPTSFVQHMSDMTPKVVREIHWMNPSPTGSQWLLASHPGGRPTPNVTSASAEYYDTALYDGVSRPDSRRRVGAGPAVLVDTETTPGWFEYCDPSPHDAGSLIPVGNDLVTSWLPGQTQSERRLSGGPGCSPFVFSGLEYCAGRRCISEQIQDDGELRSVLIVAPSYSQDDGLAGHCEARFPMLSGTVKEAGAVAKHFRGRPISTLLHSGATEGAFKRALKDNPKVIHLATHGWVSDADPGSTGILLSCAANDKEDGKLTATEVRKLQLTDTELVVLSSCGIGGVSSARKDVASDLGTAFLQAGVSHVIAADWVVNDSSTPDFFDAFYSAYSSEGDASSALREAKLSMLRSEREWYRHPHYWAGFRLRHTSD